MQGVPWIYIRMNLLFELAFFKEKKKISPSKFEIKAFWKIFFKILQDFKTFFVSILRFTLKKMETLGLPLPPENIRKSLFF